MKRRVVARTGAAVAALVISGGCLDLMGDVYIDPVHTRVDPAQPLPGEDCTDAGIASGACVVSCTPGAPRCGDNLLQRCNDTGDGWILIDQCASFALCDADALECLQPACASREYRCTETGELQVCKGDRNGFERVEQCRSAAFCSAIPGRAQCEGTACRAGRQRCNGPQIEQCREDRSGFDPVGAPCASAALCREGETEFPVCLASECTPGTFSCDGTTLSRCADDANGQVFIAECVAPDLCRAAEQRCADPVCAVGAQRCNGTVVEVCNPAQNGFITLQACASPLTCDPATLACTAAPGLPDPAVLDGPNYEIVTASRAAVQGLGLTLDLPSEWTSIDETAWANAAGTAIGPRYIASSDAARFAANFDIPGVYFAATTVAPLDVAARQAELDLSTRCTKGGSNPYNDNLYSGTAQSWTNCGVTKATTSVVVATPKSGTPFVAVVIVTMLAPRDELARTAVWDSFEIEN